MAVVTPVMAALPTAPRGEPCSCASLDAFPANEMNRCVAHGLTAAINNRHAPPSSCEIAAATPEALPGAETIAIPRRKMT
jgi:hypothetical protein